MNAKVSATDDALEAIAALTGAHGGLMFFQSGGCCDGSSPICLPEGELPLSPHDLKLGEVGGVPFYIDGDLYECWNRPAFCSTSRPARPRASRSAPARRTSSRARLAPAADDGAAGTAGRPAQVILDDLAVTAEESCDEESHRRITRPPLRREDVRAMLRTRTDV